MNKSVFGLFLPCFLISSCVDGSGSSSNNQHNTSSDEGNNVAQVVILLGQSNMEGHTHSRFLTKTMSDKAATYANGFDDVQIAFSNSGGYTSNGQFSKVKLGQGLSVNQFGPEVGIAEKLHDANKKNVYLIKCAVGSTSLSGHWISPSSRTGGGSQYNTAVKYIQECIKNLEAKDLYPEIKAICWMQGEDDSNGNQYNNYYTYTKNFIHDLREDLKLYMDLDGIGFIDAAIAAIDIWKEHDIINAAKLKNAQEDELSRYIDTNAAGLTTNREPTEAIDIYHYDSDSMIKLGRLFGEALLDGFID